MSPIRLIDFISVLISHKREHEHDIDSKILFTHREILEFIDHFKVYVNAEEIVKVLIQARKFRLSLKYMETSQVSF